MSFEVMIVNRIAFALFCSLLLAAAACTPRVNIVTGTTIGLKATPGDGSARPPQITFAYKRAEVALVPTKGKKATKNQTNNANKAVDVDAFSTLAAFSFETQWFGNTEIASFIARVWFYDLGFDFVRRHLDKIRGVTREDVQRAAQKYLRPELLLEVVVADLDAAGLSEAVTPDGPG